MSQSNPKSPNEPKPGSDGKNQDPNRRTRSYTGYVLVVLILVITILVVKKSVGEPAKVSYPEFVRLALEGEVLAVEIRKNAVDITKRGKTRDAKERASVAVPERYMTDNARDFEEMAAMGRAASELDEADLDVFYAHFAKIAKGDALPDFAVYRRYIFDESGTSKMLVKMTRPNFDASGNGQYERAQESYLFEATGGIEVTGPTGVTESIAVSFDDLLLATNPVAYNDKLGIASPADVTTTVWTGKKGAVTWAEGEGLWQTLIISLLPWLLIIGFLWFFVFRQMRGGGAGGNVLSFGKSRAKIANKEQSSVTFKDVAGVEEAKDEVKEIVEFLRHPKRFARIGGRTPRGVLLNGQPGTGKTLLAKAIAGEAEVPFFSISGSDFVEMFVGVGASRVRDLFKQARENSPCIIFLDEIDAVGRRRGAGLGGGHDEREQTLNAILVEMDGFDTDTGIIVIAATNRVDVLDPALLRPGRFDRQINVDLPDIKGREAILGVHSRKVRTHPSVDLEKIARGTPGFSGAELEAVVNEAAILATLAKKDAIDEEDLEEARDRVRWGRAKTSRIMGEDDQRVTAYHEAGHAVTAFMLPKSDPIHKVTIIPRGPALGVTMFLPERDRYGMSRGQMEAYLQVCYGGRIAEEIFCGDITSGAQNDIQQATSIARRMVLEWGMSDLVGPISYDENEENPFLGRDLSKRRQYSDATAEKIDAEIEKIIENAYEGCRKLIETHRDKVEALAEALIRYETLEREEIEGLFSGVAIEETRARELAERKSLEGDRDPRPTPTPDRSPEPDMPPGLAGEGA